MTQIIQQTEFTDYRKNQKRHGHDNDVVNSQNIRQVAGCLPIDFVNQRVMLISSKKRENAWVLPKGGWETNETQQHAAQRETWEEAGVKGKIVRNLGVFQEVTKKKNVKAHHWIFELRIESVEKKFPERKSRERRWFTFQEALVATQTHPYIQQALLKSSLNPTIMPISPKYSFEDIQANDSEPQKPLKRRSLIKSIKSIFN